MNRISLAVLALLIGGVLVHAQVPANAQAGASAQTQAGVGAQTQRSGTQASGAGSASTQTNASASVGKSDVTIAEGTAVNAALLTTLDAKKNKPGDRVEARTTQDVKQDGKVVLAKGTRLIGHVTQAQARGQGQSRSALGVVFDTAEYRSGRVPLNFEIQALAASQTAALASTEESIPLPASGGPSSGGGSGHASGGGLLGGTVGSATSTVGNVAGGIGATAGGTVNSATGVTTPSGGTAGGLNSGGMLATNSRGVFGLEGLSLDSAASSAAQGSMIVSPTSDVHLASGTQMVLRSTAQGQ